MTRLLTIQSLSFAYGPRMVCHDWSGDFDPGLTWLQGPNGSGKSTRLKLIAGALAPHAGNIRASGAGLRDEPLAYRRQVFWCGPGSLPFNHLTPLQYFSFMQGLYPRFDLSQLDTHIEGFGLNAHLEQRLHRLSSGTERKVWLAAALSAGTPVVLLDEPFNALDAAAQAHLSAWLAHEASHPTRCCIVVSHEDLGEAGQRAVRVRLAPVDGQGGVAGWSPAASPPR